MLPLLCLLAASSVETAVADIVAAAKLFAQGTPARNELTPASGFWRTYIADGLSSERVEAVRFYTPASLPLRLRHLNVLGSWKLVHQSKTSSVVFTYCAGPGRCSSVYVALLHPPGKSDALVTSIRVVTLSD